MPKLPIIVAFLNEEENIPRLYERIREVCADLPEDVELILVDDGSTDGSVRAVRSLAGRKDPGQVELAFGRAKAGRHVHLKMMRL